MSATYLTKNLKTSRIIQPGRGQDDLANLYDTAETVKSDDFHWQVPQEVILQVLENLPEMWGLRKLPDLVVTGTLQRLQK